MRPSFSFSSASSSSFSLLLTSALLVGVVVSGCAASDGTEDDGSTASELRNGRPPFGPGGPGHGGDHGGGGGDHGGGDHGDGHGGDHGPHRGGQGLGQHHDGGHFGQHGPQHINTPQGVYFADITANGSGCPDGSWDVSISDDGQTFTLAFSAYEAQVNPGQAADMKDCTLDMHLKSPDGLSYSVASFAYQGYILLDTAGMNARQTASYSFNQDHNSDESRNDVPGTFDQSYLFNDDVAPPRRAWSPCNTDSILHIHTGLSLQNNQGATGSGYINNSTVDGSLSFKWALNWRRCD